MTWSNKKGPSRQEENGIGRWVEPGQRIRVLNKEPFRGQGATLYVRPADWRAKVAEPNFAPLVRREPLLIRRHAGNSTSLDYVDFSIRGYRFHMDGDQGQVDVERYIVPIDQTTLGVDEWDLFIETGFYDGFPVDVYQQLFFYPYDYTSDGIATDVVNRYVQIMDYTREYRARHTGWPSGTTGTLLFFTAGLNASANPATDPVLTLLESVP
ncbi:MAG: hypothetical protein GWO24_19255, partial [Akkermansiaceae bacterium]|nr:hypothetical protein [Akkermansiaceae bacterium]